MTKLAELNDLRRELGQQLHEMADIPAEQWTGETDQRWDDLNDKYNETVSQIEKRIDEQEEEKARKDRIAQIAENEKRFRPQPPGGFLPTRLHEEQVAIRQEQTQLQRAIAFQGWLRNLSGKHVTEQQKEACRSTGLNLYAEEQEIICRPQSDNMRGDKGWSSRNGASWDDTQFEKRWANNIETREVTTTPSEGGYTIPQGFQYELERALKDYGGLRRVCRVWSTSGFNPIPWPLMRDLQSAVIVGEGQDIGSSVDPVFGQVVFSTYKYSSIVIATQEVLEDSAFNMSSILGATLGERLGRGTSADYASGSGTGEPEGILTNTPVATTTAANNAIVFDELLDAIHSIDPAHRRATSFGMVMNDTTLSMLRKLKDTQGRYLWEPSLQVGEPDRIFGTPYAIDQNFPSPASATKPIAIGDMSKFVIRDHESIRFYRLTEKYRHLDSTGFMIYFRSDSHPLLADSIGSGDGTNDPIKHVLMAT